jgi:hypothetical protein
VSALDRVLAAPGSLSARKALLAEWQAAGDPRAELIAKQLQYRTFPRTERSNPDARELDKAINRLIFEHGAEWSNGIAGLVTAYTYRRGLVAIVSLPGESFLRLAPELFQRAPIQHVDLTEPLGSVATIVDSPFVAMLSSLHIENVPAVFSDAEAAAFARGSAIDSLRSISLMYNDIHEVGIKALAASPHLKSTRCIRFEGNPVDPSPRVTDYDGEYEASRPALAQELERLYGPRPWLSVPTGDLGAWPPDRDELAVLP